MVEAIISCFGSIIVATITLIGVISSNSKHDAVIDEKIAELTREVREHNDFARRVPLLEDKVERLEKYHPIRPDGGK